MVISGMKAEGKQLVDLVRPLKFLKFHLWSIPVTGWLKMPSTLPQEALPLNLKIILVVSDSAEKDQYLHALEAHDAHCCVVSSLADACAHASEEPHSGIAIDVRQ